MPKHAPHEELHLLPHKETKTWYLQKSDDKSKIFEGIHGKDNAMDKATSYARERYVTLRIHTSTGEFQEERTYGGNDPYPPKG